VNERTLMDQMANEIADVLAAMMGVDASAASPADALPAETAAETVVHLSLAGPAGGWVAVALPAADATALARIVMMLDEEPPAAAVVDALQEVCSQAVGALSQRPGLTGLRVTDAHSQAAAPAGAPAHYRIQAGDRFAATVSMWASIVAETPAPAPGPVAATSAQGSPVNLDVILDIDLPLSVRFGEAEMTVLALTQLAPGSIVDLGRTPDDPVDVLVNGHLVARGEVVAVAGNYGVRITEIISPADRLKTMAA
jgi:flagellar motor switch protein FliN